jgi:superfamily II DNA or RNA helicase
MVPLIMALKQDRVRLLIADDVGIGKTIEAGLIIRELLDRDEIPRFAVVCLPHLCDQWQEELQSKFGIETVIIRSSTAARLDRMIRSDKSAFSFFPYQVISIDYIKAEPRKAIFLNECPELVIVDEAHTCARPSGASSSQQQRHHLVQGIAKKPGQHLVLLTATPHSGKQDEFQSLLGLLHPDFETIEPAHASELERRRIATSFVQRKRADVVKWMGEDTKFPQRVSVEIPYEMSKEISTLFNDVLGLSKQLLKSADAGTHKHRMQYWTALALLRGIISSPKTGAEMLRTRASRDAALDADAFADDPDYNPVMDHDAGMDTDAPATTVVEHAEIPDTVARRLRTMADILEGYSGLKHDRKAMTLLHHLLQLLVDGFHPIVFCRYIPTANYLGDILRPELEKHFPGITCEVITSELPDDLRREKIDWMGTTRNRRVLIATDCLSEGVNLQDYFSAMVHYDLPWNPNRLDQREGRIDRFGQSAAKVGTALLYCKDNPMDGVVLDVLLRKAREIRRNTGYTVAFPEDSPSILTAVMTAVLLRQHAPQDQMSMDFEQDQEVREQTGIVEQAYRAAVEKERATRSIFAQHAIKAEEIEKDLLEADEAIGNVRAVEQFFIHAMEYFNAQCTVIKHGYRVITDNLPQSLRDLLGKDVRDAKISFESPTPDGYRYVGRNHPFIEQCCRVLTAHAVDRSRKTKPARASVIQTRAVQAKTVIVQLRIRNVIQERTGGKQLVAEEMLLWGLQGQDGDQTILSHNEAKALLTDAKPSANLSRQSQEYWLTQELASLDKVRPVQDNIAMQRAEHLVETHERFRSLVGGSRYKVVEPVLPPDVMGIHILLPHINR